jgi:hypothetical protein
MRGAGENRRPLFYEALIEIERKITIGSPAAQSYLYTEGVAAGRDSGTEGTKKCFDLKK